MDMRSKRNTWLSCTVLLRMLNITPLEGQNLREKSSGRKRTTRTHVAGLNVIENQQNSEDSNKESSRRRERVRERRQRHGARTKALEMLSKNTNKRGTNSSA